MNTDWYVRPVCRRRAARRCKGTAAFPGNCTQLTRPALLQGLGELHAMSIFGKCFKKGFHITCTEQGRTHRQQEKQCSVLSAHTGLCRHRDANIIQVTVTSATSTQRRNLSRLAPSQGRAPAASAPLLPGCTRFRLAHTNKD